MPKLGWKNKFERLAQTTNLQGISKLGEGA